MPVADTPSAGSPLNTQEQSGMLTDGDGKISPATFPVPTPTPDHIENVASNLRASGETVRDTGEDIKASWSDLTSCYKAPEAEELYFVLNPVARDGSDVWLGLHRTAGALEGFAETLRGIKSRWRDLSADAHEFRARIADEGEDWNKAEGLKGAFGIGKAPNVVENEGYIERGEQLIEDYEEAERGCANRINLFIPGRTRFAAAPEGGDLDPNVFYHGYEQDLSELATEWDTAGATTDEHWWVDVGDAVWDFGVGAVEGVGAMVGAHSSEGWFQASWGDAMWENWEGTAQSVASLAGMYDAESDSYGWAGWDTVGEAWKDAAHAVVPWEEWGERPGYVIGTAVLNIGVSALGIALSATGVGAAVGAPLLAWRGAAILNNMSGSRLPDVDVPNLDAQNISLNLNLPRFAGGGRELFSFNLSDLGLGGTDPSRLTAMQSALERLQGRTEGVDGAGDAGSPSGTRPRDDDDTATTNQNRRTSPDRTVEELQDGMAFEDFFNPASPEATANRDQLGADFRRLDAEQGDDRDSWEGSGEGPEADNARVPAGVGGRDGDTLTAARDTPNPTADRRVDLTDVGDRRPDHRRDHDAGPQDNSNDSPSNRRDANLRDDNPTATNRADTDSPRDTPTDRDGSPDGDGPAVRDDRTGLHRTSDQSFTEHNSRNGTTDGPAIRPVSDRLDPDSPTNHRSEDGDGPEQDGDKPESTADGDDAPTPSDRGRTITPERAALQEKAYALLRGRDLGEGEDFVRNFVNLISTHFIDPPNNKRSLLFEAFYDKRGHRWRADTMIRGETIPSLIWDPGTRQWTARAALPPSKPPKYIGNAVEGNRRGVSGAIRSVLDGFARKRADAIARLAPRNSDVKKYKEEYKNNPSESNRQALENARETRRPFAKRMRDTSETFGEEAAKRAVRENFNGKAKIEHHDFELDEKGDPKKDENGKFIVKRRLEVDLPEVKSEPLDFGNSGPGNGNDQFDQIWETADGDGFVIVEAKSSLKTELGERIVHDEQGRPKLVRQGSREYFDDILIEMEDRGGKEAEIAQKIRRKMDEDPTKTKVHYVEAKGNPQNGRYEGNSMRLFDIRRKNP